MTAEKECQVEENASDADVKDAYDSPNPSTTRTSKCLKACRMEKLGFVTYLNNICFV